MADLVIPRSNQAVLTQAKKEGKAAYMILGGDMLTPNQYRTSLEQTWKQALNGSGVSAAGKASAYSISAVGFAATNFASQVLSEIPLMVAQRDGEESDWNPIGYFMQTASNLFWHIEAALKIYGVNYCRKVYNEYGYPTGLEWVHPDDVNPQTDMFGNVQEYYIEAVRYNPRQMVEIRTFDPDRSLTGKSEFEVALSRMTTEQSIVRHAGAFFFNSARPDGMLISKKTMTTAEAKQAEKDWKQFKGSNNAWKVFISSGQWEWIPIQSSPVDLAMPELSADVKRDICAIMRVNPALLGFADVSDPLSAGATMHEILRNYIENVALPRHKWICQHLNEQWLYPDFGHGDLYTLTANRAKMPILSDVTADRATTAVTITGVGSTVADYDETRKTLGLAPRADYFVRNPSEATGVFNAGGMALDEYRRAIGLKPLGINLGGALVKMADGRLVSLFDLAAIAAANRKAVEQAAQPPPPAFGGGFGGMSAPTPPPLPPPPPAPPPAPALPSGGTGLGGMLGKLARIIVQQGGRRSADSGSCAVLLSCAGDEKVKAIQTILKAGANPDLPPGEWTSPDDYHVTVLYAERLSKGAEQALYPLLSDMPAITMATGKLTLFPAHDNGLAPLVVLIDTKSEGGAALVEYQAKVYEAALKAEPGATLSEYSEPGKYTPHITLAYVDPAFVLPDFPVTVDVGATAIHFTREVYEVTYQAPAPADPDAVAPPVDQEPPPVQRAAMPITLSVVWPENNFILMAQRIAARAIQDIEVTAVDWNTPKNWRIDLATVNGSPGDANRILNELNLEDAAHVDLLGSEFVLSGDSIVLRVSPVEALNRLATSARLSLEAVGYKDDNPYLMGIPLGKLRIDELEPTALMDINNALKSVSGDLGMPLVAGAVSLTTNGEVRNMWALRSHTSAQAKELHEWRRKATGRRSAAAPFETHVLTGTIVESYLRSALAETPPDDIEAVKAVFVRANELLTGGIEYRDIPDAPAEYEDYWRNFDELDHDLGAAWSSYMSQALDSVVSELEQTTNPASILGVMNKFHSAISAEWVGTADNPGSLTKLTLAGMAAGNQAVTSEANMNPAARAGKPSLAFAVDWNVMSQEALDFARTYSFGLIKGLDATTQAKVTAAFEQWIQSGRPTGALKDLLTPIFKDPVRAGAIAQTESIIVYNEGAFDRWKRVGVKRAVWRTVQDKHVCPICRPLNGQVANIESGWIHPGGRYLDPYDNQQVNGDRFRGKVYRASAHTRCRCFRRPILDPDYVGKPELQGQEIVPKTLANGVDINTLVANAERQFAPIRAKMQARQVELESVLVQQDKLFVRSDELENEWYELNRQRIELGMMDVRDEKAIKRIKAKQAKIQKERDRLNVELQGFEDNERAKIIDAARRDLFTETPYKIQFSRLPSADPELINTEVLNRSKTANEFLTGIMDGEQFKTGLGYGVGVPDKKHFDGKRAYHVQGNIYMNQSDDVGTFVHEIGHAIEYNNPDVHSRIQEFLAKRTAGESPVKLKDIYPSSGYRDDEITLRDNWKHAYIGKVYYVDQDDPSKGIHKGSSELLSMGLEALYNDPVQFSIDDPEFFNFILSLTRRYT